VEYDKLPLYDGETFEQPANLFMCHQGEGEVCSGWLGHADPQQLLAVRMGISSGRADVSCAYYTTDVSLFASGAEAAEHGKREINTTTEKANAVILKIVRKRDLSTE
jgi:hypothetical protein